jgi:hypothetical protein
MKIVGVAATVAGEVVLRLIIVFPCKALLDN